MSSVLLPIREQDRGWDRERDREWDRERDRGQDRGETGSKTGVQTGMQDRFTPSCSSCPHMVEVTLNSSMVVGTLKPSIKCYMGAWAKGVRQGARQVCSLSLSHSLSCPHMVVVTLNSSMVVGTLKSSIKCYIYNIDFHDFSHHQTYSMVCKWGGSAPFEPPMYILVQNVRVLDSIFLKLQASF